MEIEQLQEWDIPDLLSFKKSRWEKLFNLAVSKMTLDEVWDLLTFLEYKYAKL